MRFKSLLLLISIMLLLPVTGLAKEKDFRKATWGMSKQEVIKSEGKKPKQTADNVIVYNDNIAGLSCYAGYIFTENKLTRGSYIFTVKHSNNNDYIADYENIKNLLKKKYGEPEADSIVWKNDLFRSEHQQWGTAISIGHLVYYSTWETENTSVELSLTGENYKMEFRLDYMSKQLKDLEKGAKEKEALDNL